MCTFVFSMKCVFTHSLCMWLCLCWKHCIVSGCDIMCYLSPVIPHFPDFLPTLLHTGPSSSDIRHPIPPPTSSIPQASILSPLPGGAERSLGLITPSVLMMPRLQLWLKFRTGFLIPEIPCLSPGCLRSILNSACFVFSWLSSSPANHFLRE